MAGRPLGSLNKNKDKLLRNLKEIYGDDFDPIMKMASIASDDKNDATLKLAAWKEIAQYVYPKLKAVEHTGSVDVREHMGLPEVGDRVEDLLGKRTDRSAEGTITH